MKTRVEPLWPLNSTPSSKAAQDDGRLKSVTGMPCSARERARARGRAGICEKKNSEG